MYSRIKSSIICMKKNFFFFFFNQMNKLLVSNCRLVLYLLKERVVHPRESIEFTHVYYKYINTYTLYLYMYI